MTLEVSTLQQKQTLEGPRGPQGARGPLSSWFTRVKQVEQLGEGGGALPPAPPVFAELSHGS